MGQKVPGGIASAARFGGAESVPGTSNGSPRTIENILLPANYKKALEHIPPGVDLLQDLVRPYRLDVILLSPPPSDEILVRNFHNYDSTVTRLKNYHHRKHTLGIQMTGV